MTGQRHMLLAWALLVSLVAALAVGVWLPLREQALDNQDSAAATKQRIRKFETLRSQQDVLTDQVDDLKQRAGSINENRLITEKSPTLGAAALQRRIKDIIDEFGASQTSSQPLKGADSGDFHRLELSVNMSGSMESIQEIIFALEHDRPRIFITQALVQASRASARRRRSMRGNQSHTQPQPALNLSVRLKVAAYMQIADKTNAKLADR